MCKRCCIMLFPLLSLVLFIQIIPATASEFNADYDFRAQEVITGMLKRNLGYDRLEQECKNAPFHCTYECGEASGRCDTLIVYWSDENSQSPKQLVNLSVNFTGGWWHGQLDMSGLPFLKEFGIPHQGITALDIKQDPALEVLYINMNDISYLDISDNINLQKLSACASGLHNIELGGNQLQHLEWIGLDSCHLPLSQLAKFIGHPDRERIFGKQIDVFFTLKKFKSVKNAKLDFSGEATINGHATSFFVTDENGHVLEDTEIYSNNGGVITFKKPGRYKVLMTNSRITSYAPNDSVATTVCENYESGVAEAYTGVIDISK